MRINSVYKLDAAVREARKTREGHKVEVLVCAGTGCLASGSLEVMEALEEAIRKRRLAARLKLYLKGTGCHGFCEKGPLVVIQPQGIFYQRVKPRDADDIAKKTLAKGEIINKLLYKDPNTKERVEKYKDIPFYAKQHRIALRNIGKIDPFNIEEYLAQGGYKAMAKALKKMTPDEIIEEIAASGLRGCGGGGFPTGKKWRTCAKVDDWPKYVLCNADEGDPGAFMDRSICEGDPHAVIEGMIIGARAVDAREGFIYVREEYPLAVKHLQNALDQAREYGLLGENILDTGFSYDIKIARGGGAFVCGESSALMKSVAGKVGEPRAKYIHSVVKGLYDKPTVLNNVETWANVSWIIQRGAKAFARMGTEKSKGTKAFSLVGKVKNTGLVEVPMGTTLREIIFGVGGGIINDRPFKGVQTGGPSGGCLPESLLDSPVDFDSLTAAGSMMGSGGMIVMDDHTCMVDVARYFVKFLTEESCGKCTPCREGLTQLHYFLNEICEGRGKNGDLDKIRHLSEGIIAGSLCALGKSAPNPVLSTLNYFEKEYRVHIENWKCPAGVCRALTTFVISEEECTGCLLCGKVCPVDAITGEKKKPHVINQELCTQCGACRTVCKFNAVLTE
ncbi:MAG: NADH-ubiquinone oxidoreductase-F iron-sulfur binding region domain-containing protein [Planctomycetota bacterium]|jgi:NADH-quinone oxidoreductase subunit F